MHVLANVIGKNINIAEAKAARLAHSAEIERTFS